MTHTLVEVEVLYMTLQVEESHLIETELRVRDALMAAHWGGQLVAGKKAARFC